MVFVTALIMAAPVYSHYYISAVTIKQVSVADSYMVVFLLPPKMKLQYALLSPHRHIGNGRKVSLFSFVLVVLHCLRFFSCMHLHTNILIPMK